MIGLGLLLKLVPALLGFLLRFLFILAVLGSAAFLAFHFGLV